jgi:hypothetical protein
MIANQSKAAHESPPRTDGKAGGSFFSRVDLILANLVKCLVFERFTTICIKLPDLVPRQTGRKPNDGG